MVVFRRFVGVLVCLLFLSFPLLSQGEEQPESMVFNFHDVDLRTVIKSVARLTGKNFIIDPGVKGKATILSTQPMSQAEVYSVFLDILKLHDYSAIQNGDVISIVPYDQAKQNSRSVRVEDDLKPVAANFITRIHQLDHVQAHKLVPILKPLLNPKSYIAAHMDSNSIIISDDSGNVDRLLKIVRFIDQGKSTGIEMIAMRHADSQEVAKLISEVENEGVKKGSPPPEGKIRVTADSRTNSILLGGAASQIKRIKELIFRLDVPVTSDGESTRVVFLRHALAKDMVPILTGMKDFDKMSAPVPASKAPHSTTREVLIQADEANNALIIMAPPALMRSLLSVIDQLDIRRAQVLIEAVVVEVSEGRSEDFGVQLQTVATDSGVIGGTSFSSSQRPGSIVGAAVDPLSALLPGFNLGFFDGTATILGTEILNIGALVSALSSNANTNILSTPSLMTLDNEEAEIIVGENVPFATGSYTSTGSTNPENPFTTYERKDVGVKLKIRPQINEGGTIRLEISQEVSKIINSTATAGLQSTDSRSISTVINVDDGEIVVMGGLISDDVQENVLKVPLLGDLPLFGQMFRYNYSKHEKKNLMIFIHPVIVRESATSRRVTGERYRMMQERQRQFNERGIPLMPGEQAPELPDRPEMSNEG